MSLSKKKIAIDIIGCSEFGLSAQVLQEFYTVATRKAEFRMSPEKALEWIENLDEFPCLGIDTGIVKTAAAASQRYGISYWDGAIIAAAEALGAPVIYTEDLNDGQSYGEVKAINPFRGAASLSAFHDNEQARL
jgi:predicted nucleic acid-binding protein